MSNGYPDAQYTNVSCYPITGRGGHLNSGTGTYNSGSKVFSCGPFSSTDLPQLEAFYTLSGYVGVRRYDFGGMKCVHSGPTSDFKMAQVGIEDNQPTAIAQDVQEQPVMAQLTHTIPGGARGHLSSDAISQALAAPAPAAVAAVAAAPSASQNDTEWAILYGALLNSLGLSPQTFQLIYPMMSWNWPTNNLGFTNAAQYDFCATIPQWSAVGAYVSSGATFDNAYQQFLNLIALNTSNPTLQQQIASAQNNLTQISQNLQSVSAQALSVYNSTVTNNNPSYTDWLGTPTGSSYASQINSLTTQQNQAQAVVTQLAKQQTTPNIANALTAYNNQAYYTKLSDPTLSTFPPVPGWSIAESAQQWVTQAQGGGGTGNSISFSNSQAAYDYSKTWAQGSASVGAAFWSVYANGSWQRVNQFYSDSSLSCEISFAAWDTIPITPSKWYSGTTAFRNGPFVPGYTATQQPGSNGYAFGQGGIVPAFKTAMLVCYQPTISISVSQSTYQSFFQQWSVAGGIQVGPFQIGGSGGGTQLNWSQSGSGMTAKVASTSNVPLIFGVTLAVQPQ